MSNPVQLFENLKDTYLRYLDSPFDLRYPDLVRERRQLLDEDGRIYRRPLIEPLPAYQSTRCPFADVAREALTPHWTAAEIAEVSGFIGQHLFPPHQHLYTHQRDAFTASLVHNQDVIVTTGTGSGKTEAFLLPIIATIVRESRSWAAPQSAPGQWDWWNHVTAHGRRRQFAPRIAQRGHERREPGMRALILYPLNALVEDQLGRLRDALDGSRARAWLEQHRSGNRIYFGRYTGKTPVSGVQNAANVHRLRDELISIERDARAVAGSPAAHFFQSLDGAEMWSRWDMQNQAPDILITNYSMLNIMLMRSLEASIFGQTRQWLQGGRDRVFYLVVDELHTYRGTPGTEVAYLLRVLLDRIGLRADSDQLRIIASSASVDTGSQGLQYLEQFFCRDRNRFRIIGGARYLEEPDPGAVASTSPHASALAQFSHNIGQHGLESASNTFAAAVAVPNMRNALQPAVLLNQALQHIQAADAVRLACTQEAQLVPQTAGELAHIFANHPPDVQQQAVNGLLTALSCARTTAGAATLPLRVHFFFRNLQGLWVCTNSNCTQVQGRTGPCPSGALHYIPTLTCACGGRVLELLYCEPCGEVFFGGYRRETGNPHEWYLSPDHPDLETAPDLVTFDRDYLRYAVYWPVPMQPACRNWTQDGVQRFWQPATLDSTDGRISFGGNSGWLYYQPAMHRQPTPAVESAHRAYPSRCPRCDADWRRREIGSPIRTQRTGFQKIAQVLADTLLRQLSTTSTDRKLVVFSDSRQDAAKLSAGMRFSHYRDALRQSLVEAVQRHGTGARAFAAQVAGHLLRQEEHAAAGAFATAHAAQAMILSLAANPATASNATPGNPSMTYRQAAQQIITRATQGPVPLPEIANETSAQLLAQGINPAGYSRTVLWSDPTTSAGSWRDLYTWTAPVAPKAQLTADQRTHLYRIQTTALAELMEIVFASGQRSLEALLLALPTTDRITFPPEHRLSRRELMVLLHC